MTDIAIISKRYMYFYSNSPTGIHAKNGHFYGTLRDTQMQIQIMLFRQNY